MYVRAGRCCSLNVLLFAVLYNFQVLRFKQNTKCYLE
jgi:hypothetical protein